jgi:dienelactone hydrolase
VAGAPGGEGRARRAANAKPTKVPAAIVLDILDGSAVVPRSLARAMAQEGVAALYVPMSCYGPRRPKDPEFLKKMQEDPRQGIDNVRQTVMDIRRAKAILASLPEVDDRHLSITGVSLGGIVATLAAGVDGGFDRVVPVLAGGDLADILYHARETRKLRNAIEARGWTREQVTQFLAPIEPLHFAARIAPRSCLMINAARDEVIPRETTEALNKAIGSPQILWTPVGHYTSALFMPNIRQRVIDFIQGKKVVTLELGKGDR